MCLTSCSSFEPFFSFFIVVTKKAILPSRARQTLFILNQKTKKKLKKKTKRIKNDVLLFAQHDFNDDSFDDRCFSAKTTSFFFFIRFFFFFFFFVFRETIFSPGGDFR